MNTRRLLFVLAVLSSDPCCSDEVKTEPHRDDTAIVTIAVRLRVVNGDDEPVVGATITPRGLRTRVERGSFYSWVEERHGPQPAARTDEAGEAELRVPKFVIEKLETGEIVWLVDHEDYILFRDNRSVDDNPANVVLKRGRRIALSAVDANTRDAITTNVHASLSGGNGADAWKVISNGMLMSRAVAPQRTMLRVYQFPDGQPTKFSDPIDLTECSGKMRILFRDIPLRVGIRVEGKIDDAVPRPVKNGTVSVSVSDISNPNEWQSVNTWRDWTTIQTDGTFVFESLPRGSVVQMIAVCDGWLNIDPTEVELQAAGIETNVLRHSASRVLPQVAELIGDRISPVIRMESTATCRIAVLDPDGNPLEGAEVGMSPNQMWLNGGSQIVGEGTSVRAVYRVKKEQGEDVWNQNKREQMIERGVRSPATRRYFWKPTDKDGIAVINTLPGGAPESPRSASVEVKHDNYEQPVGGGRGLSRDTSVMLIRSETTEVTFRMDRKGTKRIGE